MKKVILSFVAIAALTVVSCKGKDAENADANTDTTAVQTETTTEVAAPMATDTAAAPATTVDTAKAATTTTKTTEVKK